MKVTITEQNDIVKVAVSGQATPTPVSVAGGVPGLQGIQGVQGIYGIQGTAGVLGSEGTQGVQGAQGAQGLDGQFAGQGITGAQGSCALEPICDSFARSHFSTDGNTNLLTSPPSCAISRTIVPEMNWY